MDILDMGRAQDGYGLRPELGSWARDWLEEWTFGFDKEDCNSALAAMPLLGTCIEPGCAGASSDPHLATAIRLPNTRLAA